MTSSAEDAPARFDVLIVGGGHAAVQVAAGLAGKYEGSVGVLSAELHHPYQRPPLTKGYLSGEVDEHELLLRPASFWEAPGVSLLLGHRVTAVDAEAHVVSTQHGVRYSYGTLVWAAGAEPLRIGLTGADLPGVHELRTLADTAQFKREIGPGARVVVIGGGYVGLEAASASVHAGAEVSVVEAQSRLLSRVTGADVAEHVRQHHLASGVTIELDATVVGVMDRGGRAGGVVLGDGRELAADVVLISVGIRPASSVLADAGARCSNGVEIDLRGRTSLPDVYAAGDCTCFPTEDGARMRLESLQNAVEQGDVVAQTILGEEATYSVVPYFWSNQVNLKIKTIGLVSGHDETLVRRGPAPGSLTVVYLRGGRVCAVDAVNAMKDYVDARHVLGARVDPNLVTDPTTRLRDAFRPEVAGHGAA
ncbi:NAD(P)/FAD-dependent oxidoreductase [Nocardioides alkalitolerans]|uniref:NAD(P)/FAD-dependent oxidoreductase n=1 Tax=Nocardioides alkalitolerans TaxID=281714 RepID=UPI0004182F7D|nr:FAD-dependent oxidoreductase [Nocardioides alkalitolerans]